jgi:hypothetical protein
MFWGTGCCSSVYGVGFLSLQEPLSNLFEMSLMVTFSGGALKQLSSSTLLQALGKTVTGGGTVCMTGSR